MARFRGGSRVLDAYPHLAPLAPADLFADAAEPELDDHAR